MADTHATQPDAATGPSTAEGFLIDRMAFWHNVTTLTARVAGALIVFCAWLWWAAFAGFTFLHVILLPIGVGAVWVIAGRMFGAKA